MFYVFIGVVCMLGNLGGQPVEYPYIVLGQSFTILYFGYFLILILSFLEMQYQFVRKIYFLHLMYT
jgi:uncharacterized membrane protein YcaP (DUF421 family)